MLDDIIGYLHRFDSITVAFSGGVDSSVVAAAAQRSGRPCVAVTAKSPAVATWQLDLAKQLAAEIGIRHLITETDEWQRDAYRRNKADRCYHCKQTLYDFLDAISDGQGGTIVSGTNADDLGDHRPGIRAGRQAGVMTPLADLGIGKTAVRQLARLLGLPNADLPASPCLASRIAYGVEVTPERLGMVEQAEDWLRKRGWTELRVRLHADELARIEVPSHQVGSLASLAAETDLLQSFRQIGFRFVTLDLFGLTSGSMNQSLVQLEIPGSETAVDHGPNLSSSPSPSQEPTDFRSRTDQASAGDSI